MKKDGAALQWCNNPTFKVQAEAVNHNVRAIKFVKVPNEKLYTIAIKNALTLLAK